ncbi:uncharacterized protein DUF4199 [Pontibacter ummariensis]|uniref:DUF4199 domain-containing protein n=1 Tax=Pontibacter ummariensis TaxID=1610492 RepID=A0A239FTN4_9BACT|nr:DUF4199 domain-containing protein [Pontibacter ummariensis]PRY11923.1 uncharacterized protein DUF4199 [Pontibacter ummariensis]SNS60357.1 Protein of unknown function [Pontibacter ummariensis]
MASSKVTYQKVSTKWGILTGIAYIAYFLIMWALGVLEIIELSFISGIFLVIGICVAISRLKRARNGNIEYFEGLAIGATVGVISSAILALFLVIFVSVLDTDYLASLQASSFFPEGITKMALFGFTIMYGTVPGLWIAFIAMQWFKRRDHSMSEGV